MLMGMYERLKFTERDRRILELIIEAQRRGLRDVYGYVGQKLLLDRKTVANRMYLLRKKYEACLAFGQEYRDWRRKIRGHQFL
jgi:hypothetical protein